MFIIKKKKEQFQKGFTLIELMVVIALMGIISGVTLANYSGMNRSVELQNTVYNIALSMRESQVYGINKKQSSGDFSDGTPNPYGIHIEMSAGRAEQIIMFEDKKNPTRDNVFEGDCTGTGDIECISIIKLNKGNHISSITIDGTEYPNDKINILFRRPNPDAEIYYELEGGGVSDANSRIGIEISSEAGPIDGYSGCVEIGAAGDISIRKECN